MAALDRNPQAGFTLLELLTVIVIISLVSGLALVSLAGLSSRGLQSEAERMEDALRSAADEAVFEKTATGAYLTQTGYGFVRYDDALQRWVRMDGAAMRYHALGTGLSLSLVPPLKLPESGQDDIRPALVFYSSGESTAFTLRLSSGRDGAHIVIASDGINPVARRPDGAP